MFDFKKLVSSMVHRTEATSKTVQTATQLVKELPANEYAGALVEIVKSIIKINSDTKIPLKERLTTLLYIDERTHSIHHSLSEGFIIGTPSIKSYLPSILAYLKEFSTAYMMCLRLYHSAPVPSLLEDIRLANARGLNHQMHLILWKSLNYLKSEGTLWQHGYKLYQYAEEMGYERFNMRLYDTSTRDTSCEQILLRGAMLRLAQTENLSPQEIVAVERLVFSLADSLRLEKHSNPTMDEPVYALNLEVLDPPQPLRRGMVGKSFRYWSAMPVVNQLADIMLDMDKGLPPVLLDTRMKLNQHQWNELCLKLAARWSRDGGLSLRKSERQHHSAEVSVDVGFDRCAFLVKVQYVSSTETEQEEWRIYDVSTTGLGLSYFGKKTEMLALKRILLVRQPNGTLKVGVIRRIVSEKSGVSRIGVEQLGHSPIGVSLINPNQPDTDPVNGLYVTQPNSSSGKRWFLIPKKMASIGQELVFTVQGLSYRIRLKGPQQMFDDCVHSDFDTLGRVE
jgi:hypothetical protein